VAIVGPAEGVLAHGDEGLGRMAEPDAIVDAAVGG
jgi:phosphopantothenoylcysteine synthetase/decarboxylase